MNLPDNNSSPQSDQNQRSINREDYLKLFSGDSCATKRQSEALRQAHDIRKFEIDLYWKRAAYFWAFIAAAFAGYFALQKNNVLNIKSIFVITCLGFVVHPGRTGHGS